MILSFFKISVLVVFSSVAEVEKFAASLDPFPCVSVTLSTCGTAFSELFEFKFALGDSRMAILVVATCSSALSLVWI